MTKYKKYSELNAIGIGQTVGELKMRGHNICIGPNAGINLTDESYQLCISTGNAHFQTTMTEEEYEIINKVIQRAKSRNIGFGLNHLKDDIIIDKK